MGAIPLPVGEFFIENECKTSCVTIFRSQPITRLHFTQSSLFREKCYPFLQTLHTVFPQFSTGADSSQRTDRFSRDLLLIPTKIIRCSLRRELSFRNSVFDIINQNRSLAFGKKEFDIDVAGRNIRIFCNIGRNRQFDRVKFP